MNAHLERAAPSVGEATDTSAASRPSVPPPAAWLGGLGLIPFVAGAALVMGPEPSWALDALRFYAAAILAFMGGIHWGLAMGRGADMGQGRSWIRLGGSVLPALIAWLALLLPASAGLMVMAGVFALLLVGDIAAVRRQMAPAWYPRLRVPLTLAVVVCLMAASLSRI